MNDRQKQAEENALHWLILLQEAPDDAALRARFLHWRDSHSDNQRAWAAAQQTWALLGETPRADRLPPPVVRRARWRYVGSALAAVVAVLVLLSPPAMNLWRGADYSTDTAEIRTLQLDDGSSLHLAADSAVKIDYQPGVRQIHLLKGEAWFDVQPDVNRPFRVIAANVTTTVLGTAFDVSLAGHGVAVAVGHGRVQVSTSASSAQLAPPLQKGDWLRIDADGHVERGQQQAESIGAWRRGQLQVKDRPVAEVVEEIGRYHRGTLLITDDALASRRVTGLYNLNSPSQALEAVALTYNARIRHISPWLTLISSR